MDYAAIIAAVAAPCIAVLTLFLHREREHARNAARVAADRIKEAREYATAEEQMRERYRADNAAQRDIQRELATILATHRRGGE